MTWDLIYNITKRNLTGGQAPCEIVPTGASSVNGHLVQSDLTATIDHLLIDKQDFNCPISYTFAEGKRMWYQRMPDLYVDFDNGWETVSLPFNAELVTTQQKGEITHFYSGSRTIENSDAKIGHEYWLREYDGQKAGTDPEADGFFTADFYYPDADDEGDTKTVGNTFLWDYYYHKNDQKDAHADTYQEYYKTARDFAHYPLLAASEPYIIGFPSIRYREFDLSGEWTAKNTATSAPAKLDKQAISFVSKPGITINVSDDELTAVTKDGYSFKPNYMSMKVEGYLMNTDGDSFDITPTGGLVTIPFRPYFVAAPAVQGARGITRSIVFNMANTIFDFDDDKQKSIEDELGEGTIEIYTLGQNIAVTSTLHETVPVQIYTASGTLLTRFDISPDETVKTPAYNNGVYIVRADGGRYQKKLIIR